MERIDWSTWMLRGRLEKYKSNKAEQINKPIRKSRKNQWDGKRKIV